MTRRELEYVDFELNINHQEEDRFRIDVSGPCGEPKGEMQLPFGYAAVEDWMAHNGMSVSGSYQPLATNPLRNHTPRELGTRLFDALFSDAILENFRAARAKVREQKKGLRLALRFDTASEEHLRVARLPWELICDPKAPSFLILENDIILIRYLEQNDKIELPPQPAPIHIVAVIANPEDEMLGRFDARSFEQSLKEQCKTHMVDLQILPKATLACLRDYLVENPCDILHFTGHGGSRRGTWALAFENEDGGSQYVTAEKLVTVLSGADIRLINLTSCETGRADRQRGFCPFNGMAHALAARQIPAVVAMQFPIKVPQALAFTKIFYRRLVKGDAVDVAVDEARIRLLMDAEDNHIDWCTPVLFTRARDGRLFSQLPKQIVHMNCINILPKHSKEGEALINVVGNFQKSGNKPTRHIRNPSGWEQILEEMQQLKHELDNRIPVHFYGQSYLSLWFALGYVFRQSSRFKVSIDQLNRSTGLAERWMSDIPASPVEIDIRFEAREPSTELVIIVNLARDCESAIRHYMKGTPLEQANVLSLSPKGGAFVKAVEDNAMAVGFVEKMGETIRETVARHKIDKSHFFLATPSSVALFLGTEMAAIGSIQVYEYTDPGYAPAFLLN